VKTPPNRSELVSQTSATEWVAAGVGLLLTLGVLGYVMTDLVSESDQTPELTVTASQSVRVAHGYLLPITVRNAAAATAAAVKVSGRLERQGVLHEERHAEFAYVPGEGAAKGGLLFERDPHLSELKLRVEGFEEP
jgi:uncharacterized protein (TIGR02588 family)